MCSKWWLILLAVVILGVNVRNSTTEASGRARAPKKQTPAKARTVDPDENVVDGFGTTATAAKERALVHAQERVERLLQDRYRETNWKPPEELLATDFLTQCRVVQPLGEPKLAPGLGDEKAMVARYKVELTRDYLQAVQRVAREQRVQERHLILARVLGGLVVLLLVAAGYLRLEDMTRGYATTMLRVAAFSLVAIAGGALWLIR
jgi:hypothetical protein